MNTFNDPAYHVRSVHRAWAVELLSGKIGTVLFVLGLMHFFNLYVFSRFAAGRSTG